MQQTKAASRERICALTIAICFTLLLISLISVRMLNVKVDNIEHVDRNYYTVITEKGNVNITSDSIIRIERTYTKAPLSSETIELDKIYTDKGFIYISSEDFFYPSAVKLINSVDFYGLPVWEKPNTDWKDVKPYSYMIGTPEKQITLLNLFLSLQYIALSVGALALTILIFPLRLHKEEELEESSFSDSQQEPELQELQELNKEESYTLAK